MRIPNLARYLSTKGYASQQALLLYGNDEAALQFHLDLLVGSFKKEGLKITTVDTLEQVDLGREPGLFEEPNAPRVTVCRKVTGRDFPALEKLFPQLSPEHKLILLGPNLGSKIKMVTFFQKEVHVGAIPSYEVSIPLLREVIQGTLAERKLALSPEHIDVLVEAYGGSPLSMATDMEKIELYLKSTESIALDDLKQLVNGGLKLDIDQLIEGFLERNKEKILRHGDVALLEAEPYLILRSLIRQMVTFCEFMSHRAFTGSASQAIAAMKTPLFFSTKPLFERADRLWNLKLAAHGLRHLLLLEKRFKGGELSLPQFQGELCLYCR